MLGSIKRKLFGSGNRSQPAATSPEPQGYSRDAPLRGNDKRWVAAFVSDFERNRLDVRLAPTNSISIMKEIDDPKSTSSDLAAAIQRDPALTASLLKLANSSMFGKTNMPLGLEQAVGRVGKKQLKGLLLSVMLSSQMARGPLVEEMSKLIWRDSLVCAKVAAALAPPKGPIADAAFLAGMFHDIGALALLNAVQDRESTSRGPKPSRRAILEVLIQLGYTANGQIVSDWSLPTFVRAAVTRYKDDITTKPSRLAVLLGLANDLCSRYGLPIDAAPPSAIQEHPGLRILGKRMDDLPTLDEIEAFVAQASQL